MQNRTRAGSHGEKRASPADDCNDDEGTDKGADADLPELMRPRGRLRTGYTTGTCAAAAAKAALIGLTDGRVPPHVTVTLPSGAQVSLAVEVPDSAGRALGGTDVRQNAPLDAGPAQHARTVTAVVVKDAGDDPDCTNGARMTAAVEWLPTGPGGDNAELLAGEGIGTVTLPGLGIPVGGPSITPVPRRMIARSLAEVSERGVRVTFSVPDGEVMASETTNARLGIVGGISILGTTGIVRPFSTAAYRASILKQVDVAAAQGVHEMILSIGSRSEKAAMAMFPSTEPIAFVEVGDFTGAALKRCAQRSIDSAVLFAMAGKITKLAAGVMMTHFHLSAVDTELLARLAADTGAPPDIVTAATETATARHFYEACEVAGFTAPLAALCALARVRVLDHIGGRLEVRVNMLDYDGTRIAAHS